MLVILAVHVVLLKKKYQQHLENKRCMKRYKEFIQRDVHVKITLIIRTSEIIITWLYTAEHGCDAEITKLRLRK